jgi:hypothetical protein
VKQELGMMDAAVIVHRWFEQGAGWAYAPEIEEIKLDLIASLDKFLKAAKPGPFHVDLRDGACVIGNIFEDIECSDSKAKDRKPTILRAAFLRHIPSDEQSQVILERLCSLWPSCPGPDPQLVIEVANSLTARLPEPAVDLARNDDPCRGLHHHWLRIRVQVIDPRPIEGVNANCGCDGCTAEELAC